jgi:uncharacterized phiE125 gp8 family phage protein
MSALVLVSAPATTPVSLTEAKAHLRVDHSDDDTLITALINAAVAHLDGKDGILGRALITQTWDLKLDEFCPAIRIPLPPLASVTSITYVDTDGATQTLAADQYTVTSGEPAKIVPAYNVTWPSTRCVPEAVKVRFVAGYGNASSVPAGIKAAILLHVGTLYRDRETVNIGNIINELPAYDALIAPYKVWSFA